MILDADDHYYRRRTPNQRWLIPSAAPTASVGIGAAAAAGLARSYFDGTHYFYEKKNDYHHNHHHRRLIDNTGAAYFARGYVPFDRADSWSGYPLINLNIGSSRAKWRYNKCEDAGRSSAGFSSNFVIHKQGVPLIRSSNNSRRYNANNNSGSNSSSSSSSSSDNNISNRRWKDKEIKSNNSNNSTDSKSEEKSVAGASPDIIGSLRATEGDSSGLCGNDASAEASPQQTTTTTTTSSCATAVGPNSLPRIIKPRKRRKKERKSDSISSVVNAVKEPPTSKNLQTADIVNSRRRSSTENPSDFIPEENGIAASNSSEPRRPAPAAPAYDLNSSNANVEDGVSILTSSCPSHSGGTYYDLEGVIWDLDDKLLLLNSAAASADRSSSVKKEDWTFKNDSGDGDGKPSSLRRSWSDIGTASSPSNVLLGFSNRSRTASSDCCYGSSYYPEKRENFDRASYASCVGVSSTIVTSPDGHRDIEIKFYSAASASPIVLG